jgi:hypothetical protein
MNTQVRTYLGATSVRLCRKALIFRQILSVKKLRSLGLLRCDLNLKGEIYEPLHL